MSSGRATRSLVQWTGLAAGPLLALAGYLALPDQYAGEGGAMVAFSHAGRATAAAGLWMAVWWMTEAIPIYATALLPLGLLPLLQARTIHEAASPYGHELIYLFMGGFLLALTMQRWGLHRRVALRALSVVGTRPPAMVGGFMAVTALLSMWVSNTATTIMMLPIALSVIELVATPSSRAGEPARAALDDDARRNLSLCLLLGIAYGASIGGIGTLVGTPPNLFLASFVQSEMGVEISFVRWMGVGLPLVVVFLPLAWLLLTRRLFRLPGAPLVGGQELIRRRHAELGPMAGAEKAVLVIFGLTALTWIFRPLLADITVAGAHPLAGLSDPGVAMLAAVLLFVIPVDRRQRIFLLDWETALKLPWGILVLFGGGLSLAAAIQANGVGEFLGHQVAGLRGLPSIVVVMGVTALMIFLTELTSNTASTATLVPILYAVAPALGLHPFLVIVPAAIAASGAFMLPVATPPNAIVFGSGLVRIPQMCRAGLWLNLLGIVLITALSYAVIVPVLGAGG